MHALARRAILLTIAYLAPLFAFATDYYISTSGNDSNPGSFAQPWQTVHKANQALLPGDTAYFLSGIHSGSIKPWNSGSEMSPITYKALETGNAHLVTEGSQPVVEVIEKRHVIIEGFTFENTAPSTSKKGYLVELIRAENIYLNNNRLKGATNVDEVKSLRQSGVWLGGVKISGGRKNRIESNTITGFVWHGVAMKSGTEENFVKSNYIGMTFGDSIRIDSPTGLIQRHIVEGNELVGSVTSDGVQTNGDFSAVRGLDTSNRGVIIRDNVIYGHAENGIDIKGSKHFLIENNLIFGNISDNNGYQDGHSYIGGPGGISKGSNAASMDIIIRNNFIYDNNAGVLTTHGYKIYNNTIVGNNRDYRGKVSPYDSSSSGLVRFVAISDTGWAMESHHKDMAIKNNIMAGHKVSQIRLHPKSQADVDGNLYHAYAGPTQLTMQKADDRFDYTLVDWIAALEDSANFAGGDSNALEGYPFAKAISEIGSRPERADFHLSSNSIAIDAGVALTRTASDGSGNKLTLEDAGYFFDGFGVASGDFIVIGSNQRVQIIAIDYTTNVVTIDRNISWQTGEDVHLTYFGAAPDIGAAEYTTSADGKPKPPKILF